MAVVSGRQVVMTRGEGVWVWDRNGRRYLDASAGLWHTNVGHGRSEIRDAVAAQLGRLETHHVFGDYANEPALELAERLAALAPDPDSRIFLLSGGGDAIDTAAKLARLHWSRLGSPERVHILTRASGYHGTHGFGTSLAGIPANQAGYGPLIPDISSVQHDSIEALEHEIARVGPGRVAAFLFEPVIASGGLLPPEPGYLEAAQELCRSHGILTIADAVVCGFGRLGDWYGVERFGLTPDLIAFAKGVTSGYLPLGGVVVAPTVADAFFDHPGEPPFRHGPTYSGHATVCAAAIANLKILEEERLLERSLALEAPLFDELRKLADHPLVEDVRGGVGFLAGFDLSASLVDEHPGLSMDALAIARGIGILTRPLDRGLAVAPPLIADRTHIGLIGDGLRLTLDALGKLLERRQESSAFQMDT
jgi:putrescine aminotransferase